MRPGREQQNALRTEMSRSLIVMVLGMVCNGGFVLDNLEGRLFAVSFAENQHSGNGQGNSPHVPACPHVALVPLCVNTRADNERTKATDQIPGQRVAFERQVNGRHIHVFVV